MILIGMFDSPFVRRVAVSLRLLEVAFEHRNWSAYRDFELIRQFNPLGRVPALVLPDGEALIDSNAILDFLDDSAGPGRALLPRSGVERRRALHIIALALGAADKGILLLEDTLFRPQTKSYEPRLERFRSQMHGALAEIDRLAQMQVDEWMVAGRMTQADITLTCVFGFLCDALRIQRGRAKQLLQFFGQAALEGRLGARTNLFHLLRALSQHPVVFAHEGSQLAAFPRPELIELFKRLFERCQQVALDLRIGFQVGCKAEHPRKSQGLIQIRLRCEPLGSRRLPESGEIGP